MDHQFLSIVEKLAILEGRITPKEHTIAETATKQKKPALFNNLKKEEAPAGVAEEKSTDVLSQVKASLADYLKSAEDDIKQDKDLVAKKKQDLDLKKKELKDLELQAKKNKETEEVTEISKEKVGQYYSDVVKQQVEKTGLQPDMYNKLEPKRQKGIDRATTRLMSVDEEESRVDPILLKALKRMPDGLSNHHQVLDAAYDAYAMEKGYLAMKGERGTTDVYIPKLMDLYKQKNGLTFKEADTLDEDHVTLQPGDRVCVVGPNEYQGEFAEVVELSPSGKFVVISLENTSDEVSMHLSDVEYTADESQMDDDDDYDDSDDSEFIEEEPNQTPAKGEAPAGETDPTYAQGGNSTYAESAPVKTVDVPLEEMGGSVLVEIHGDERNGFRIRRAGKELPTRFASLAEAEMALEMFNIKRAERRAAEQSADYIEEK